MAKIKDLIDFEEIKDVIDIDSDLDTVEGKKNMVRDYIISERLKPNIIDIAKNIIKPGHKSVQIIGGYGSGKSHLLAWIVSLLENKELVDDITDEDVKSKFKEALKRDFAVIQFELQPGASPLSDFFFDRIEQQLEDKHGIRIPVQDKSKPADFKKDIKDILNKIKEKDPTMGFVVVIDEISDFLKQKNKQQINRDVQFLRILGQVSQSMDFLFIGSMQENVFSSPKYVDEAESFGRVSERFYIVTISREDIEKVISKRVLRKDLTQRSQIDKLLSEYKKIFPPINANPDSYIDLFPVHPYVTKIFNELPFFEKRGVIQFTTGRVKEILDYDFPKFITYDSVFDEINSKHTIRNLDEVHPVIEVVETLDSKVDLLEKDKQEDARSLIKALAVLKLYGKTVNNGATPEELANELLITSKTIRNVDRILLILDKVREVTSGQFVGKTKNNYFYINLEVEPDYDVVIERKMKNLPQGMEDEELLNIIKYTDLIDAQHLESYIRIFKDTATWPDKKSFRMGHFILDDGSEQVKKGNIDFNLVICSPYRSNSKISSSKDTAILSIAYSEEIDQVLKKLAATRLLISEGYVKGVMKKKHNQYTDGAKTLILKTMLDSEIEIDGTKRKIKSVITKEPENIDEFFHYLKENLFNTQFSSTYTKYPKFLNQISYENIKGEVETTIEELTQKGEKSLFSNAKNILSSLDLIDIDGNIDTESSLYAKVIIQELEKNRGKNVKIEDLMNKLKAPPFGLDEEMTYLIFAVLTYTGQINLRKRGGGTITSSNLLDVLKSGLEAFKNIPYAALETEFPVEAIVKLFRALDLNAGLARNPKDRTKAIQDFRSKALGIKETLDSIKRGIEELSTKPDPVINTTTLSKKINETDDFPIDDFLAVKTVNDFKKVKYTDTEIHEIENRIGLTSSIKKFLDDYNNFIYKEYSYVKGSIKWLDSYPEFFSEGDKAPVKQIYAECKPLVTEISNILDPEKRRMLKGKLEQYKRKYISLYYVIHTKTIGRGIHWDELDVINKSKELRRLRDIKAIRCINPLSLNKLDEQIISLSNIMCNKLMEDHLKDNYICTWCSFPENLKDITNINKEIENMQKSISSISEEWRKTILAEIENYKDNIDLLSPSEKKVIEKLRAEKKLPGEIEQNLIAALNNLFSELKEVEILPREIMNFVFSESSVLDYETFSRKLDEYKEKMLEAGDKKNIRIKMKEGE